MCNPKLIEKIVESVDNSTKILVDESYIELTDHSPGMHTMTSRIKEFDNLIVLRHFSLCILPLVVRIRKLLRNLQSKSH